MHGEVGVVIEGEKQGTRWQRISGNFAVGSTDTTQRLR